MTKRYVVSLALAVVCAAAAQEKPELPRFEVASVKAAAESGGNAPPGMRETMRKAMRSMQRTGMIPALDAGRVRINNWTLLDLISAAYRVRAEQVSGPSWLSDETWDIEAKVPEGTPHEHLNGMLQALLEDRFGLVAHREQREDSGYALVVGKNGPKLKPAEPPSEADANLSPEEQQAKAKEQAQLALKKLQDSMKNGTFRPGLSRSTWQNTTMEELAAGLVRFAGKPVVDMTGIEGKYQVSIETWRETGDDPGQTVFVAVEKLGLKLEPRKLTLDTVVVDRVSKKPTEN